MPSTPAFTSKRAFVYQTLRAEILTGTRAPEARLVIDELAGELGVSPIPVREALQELQHDGLVVIDPYVGVRVAPIHAGLIEEVFALLEALEVISGQYACIQMTDVDFTELDRMLMRMDGWVADLDAWSLANVDLHRFICARAGLALVPAIMDRTLNHWQRLRRHYLEDVFARRVEQAQAEHWELLAALRTRDPQHVAALIRDHNRHALTAYLAYLTQTGLLTPSTIQPRRQSSS